MRVVFRVEGVECSGEMRDLSRHGVFVVGQPEPAPRSADKLELLIEFDGDSLPLAGEVVRVTPEGFAVAFGLLLPETLEKLEGLLGSAHAAPAAGAAISSEQARELISVDLSGDWRPPVCEPILHQWSPDSKLVPPSPGEPQRASWESLPTIAQAAESEPAPQPSQPESPAAAPGPAATLSQAAPVPTPLEASIIEQARAEESEPAPARAAEPSPADRRESERSEQSIPVTFDNLTGLIKEFTHNISFGGLFVYTEKSFEKGAEVAVTLVHPVHGERLTLLARIAHAGRAPSPDPISGKPRYGIGVQFRLPLEELKRVLSDFISSHKRSRGTGEHSEIIEQARQLAGRESASERELLGVGPEAKPDEIRRAYFSLVDRFHPDRFYGKVEEQGLKVLEDLFKKLTRAYETLTN